MGVQVDNFDENRVNSLKLSSRARLKVIFGPNRYKALPETDRVLTGFTESSLRREKSDEERVSMITDAFLIHYAASGTDQAFEALREKYFQSSIALIHELYYGGFNRSIRALSREELHNELWARLWRNLKNYDMEKANFYTWMKTIAVNLMRDRAKEEKKQVADHLDDPLRSQEDEDGDSMLDKTPDTGRTPDQYAVDLLCQQDYLSVLFSECGYPWQLLCAGFRMLEQTPKEIAAQYADKTLDELFVELKNEFSSKSQRTAEELADCFTALESSLGQPLENAFPQRDKHYAKVFEPFLHRRAGELKLALFFGDKPEKNISDWHSRVMGRLKKSLSQEEPAEKRISEST